MVIKGNSRGGPSQLARHLLRTDTNERVEVLELHSPIGELHEAFRDWQLLSEGTRGTKGLYHANIDPAQGYEMTREQWVRAVDVLEEQLGLAGQPRAIVLHEKNGREHIHVVWQRTNIEEMKLVHDGFNYLAHEKASYQLEEEFGHEHVLGKHAKRDREKQPEFPKQKLTHEEWQQKERTGVDPEDRKAKISALYEASDNAKAFQAALDDAGYILAKGDRRDFVVVDEYGHALSLSRQLPKVRAQERREFMADLDRNALPSVEQARTQQEVRVRERPDDAAREQTPEQPKPEAPAPDSSAKDQALDAAIAKREAEELAKILEAQAQEARQTERVDDQAMQERMAAFDRQQKAERDRFEREQKKTRGALEAVAKRIRPGAHAARERQLEKSRLDLASRQKDERNAYLADLRRERGRDLELMAERHRSEIADVKARQENERDRYRREHKRADELRREMEEERARQRELGRSRDGPDRAR